MPATTTKTYRVPHTDNLPERCPHCGSTCITRKRTRKKKLEIARLYLLEFECRFDRRYDLAALMPRLCYVAVRAPRRQIG